MNVPRKKRPYIGLKIFLGVVVVIIIGIISFIIPQLFIATGYIAKEVCSCVFIADRTEASIYAEDTGVFPGQYVKTSIDRQKGIVRSSIWGMYPKTAVYREGLGCTLVEESKVEEVRTQEFALPTPTISQDSLPWPLGNQLSTAVSRGISSNQLDDLLDSTIIVPGTRALVVVHNNQLLGERYAPGFDKDTRILGWSMNKSITQALVGILVKEGKLKIHQPAPVKEWEGDERKSITLHHLLQMSSWIKVE